MWQLCSVLSHAPSQVHRQGDLCDEVDGMEGDAVELLDDERGRALELSQDTCGPCGVYCCFFRYNQATSSFWLLGGNGDVGEIVKSMNDAGVLMMSTLDS